MKNISCGGKCMKECATGSNYRKSQCTTFWCQCCLHSSWRHFLNRLCGLSEQSPQELKCLQGMLLNTLAVIRQEERKGILPFCLFAFSFFSLSFPYSPFVLPLGLNSRTKGSSVKEVIESITWRRIVGKQRCRCKTGCQSNGYYWMNC